VVSDEALLRGVPEARLSHLRREALGKVGSAYESFRRRVPAELSRN
jgi:hypothetical protein